MVMRNRNLLILSLCLFRISNSELIRFMRAISNNRSLKQLSLESCTGFDASHEIISTILDSLSDSGLAQLNLGGTPLAGHPGIEAQLQRNAAAHREALKEQPMIAATAARLFLCGDAFAGKTTLLKTLSRLSQPVHLATFLHKAKSILHPSRWDTKNDRTRGIEVRSLRRDNTLVSVWDMAGQIEYHAFHDHMFPNPSAHGSPAFFLFVWSPVQSQDGGKGKNKNIESFERSLRYWLKFITSKTRQSNVARKIIVLLTRKDQIDILREFVQPSADRLMRDFHKIIELVGIWEVDARDPRYVKDVANCIFSTARALLKNVKIYEICSKLKSHLNRQALQEPMITWKIFLDLCWNHCRIEDPSFCKAIASSLNESGDLIYLHDMEFLILNSNWFCHEIMGDLIHFSSSDDVSRTMPIKGFVGRLFLEKLLKGKQGTKLTVSGAQLVDLMEALHLCCPVPDDSHPQVFIPATLSNVSDRRKALRWRGGEPGRPNTDFALLGRRLECGKRDLTFLTPGLFPLIQVSFHKAFSEVGADIQLDKDFISIYHQDVEIMVEFCEAIGGHVIDVLVRSSKGDQMITLEYVEDKVIKAITEICAQPVGDQGVELVEGIIRPDCLNGPVSSHLRENQYVLVDDLEKDLLRQLQKAAHPEKFLYTWKHNESFQAGASSIQELLGIEEFSKVVKSYEATLQEVGEDLGITENGDRCEQVQKCELKVARLPSSLLRGGYNAAKENLEENVVTICRLMAIALPQLHDKVDALHEKMDALHKKMDDVVANIGRLQSEILPRLQDKIETLLSLDEEKEAGRLPRFCFLTTEGLTVRRKLLTALTRDLESIRLELFCEDRRHPHRVDGQVGISVTLLEDGMVKNALPYFNAFLKILTLIAKVGAHVVANMSHSIPDFTKIIALVLDTPEVWGGRLPEVNGSLEEGFANFEGWEQWLVSVLLKNGGVTESNIASKFNLRRARYADNFQVAWLCKTHYQSEQAYPLLP